MERVKVKESKSGEGKDAGGMRPIFHPFRLNRGQRFKKTHERDISLRLLKISAFVGLPCGEKLNAQLRTGIATGGARMHGKYRGYWLGSRGKSDRMDLCAHAKEFSSGSREYPFSLDHEWDKIGRNDPSFFFASLIQ